MAPSDWISTPRLPLEDEELAFVDKVIDNMISQVKRNAVAIERPVTINSNARECEILDKIIMNGVDSVRPTLKTDFVEKLFDRLLQRDPGTDDGNASMGMLTLRFIDSFKLVLSVTKKYRGAPHAPPFDADYAREQLKMRGLWKK